MLHTGALLRLVMSSRLASEEGADRTWRKLRCWQIPQLSAVTLSQDLICDRCLCHLSPEREQGIDPTNWSLSPVCGTEP